LPPLARNETQDLAGAIRALTGQGNRDSSRCPDVIPRELIGCISSGSKGSASTVVTAAAACWDHRQPRATRSVHRMRGDGYRASGGTTDYRRAVDRVDDMDSAIGVGCCLLESAVRIPVGCCQNFLARCSKDSILSHFGRTCHWPPVAAWR